MKSKAITKVKPNPALFKNSKVGRVGFKPLSHKDGSNFSDIDYFELLGRKCLKLDEEQAKVNKSIPANYGEGYDRDVCEVAKQVCKGIDAGMTKRELTQFLNTCIKIEE